MTPIRHMLRFTRRFVVASFAGISLVALAAVVVWLTLGSVIGNELSRLVNQRVFADQTTRLTVGKVTGSVFRDVSFEDVRLERRVAGEWKASVRASRVEARYDLWALLHGERELQDVRVYAPIINIDQDTTGRWVLPVGSIPGERGGGRGAKKIRLTNVMIDNGLVRVVTPRRGWEADSVSVQGGIEVVGDQVRLSLGRASFTALEPIGRVESLTGELLVAGRKIRGNDVSVAWAHSSVRGTFHYDPADSAAGLSARVEIRTVPLSRLAGITDSRIIPTQGEISGLATLGGGIRRTRFEADLSGWYTSHVVDSLSVAGEREGSRLDISRLRVRMKELDVESARGTLDLARGGHIQGVLDFNSVQLDSIPIKAVNWIPGVAAGRLDLDLTDFKGDFGPLIVRAGIHFTGREAFGVPIAAATGTVAYETGHDVRIDNVLLVLPDGGTVSGGGLVHPGDVLDLSFTAATGDWSQLRPVIAIPGLKGAGRATGRITGTGSRPVLDVAGEFRHFAGWEMEADSLHLARVTGPFVPVGEFDGTVTATGLKALGRTIDHVDMDFSWREPRLTFPRLHAVDNDTLADTGGWADFDPPRTAVTVTLPKGHLTIGPLDWKPATPVVITGLGTDYQVHRARWSSAAGSAMVEATFATAAGTMVSRFSDMKIDLVVMAGAQKPPEFKRGLLGGDLVLSGPVLLPNPSGRLRFSDYEWAAARIDSMLVVFRVNNRRLDVDTSWADAGAGRICFAGGADLPEPGWTLWNEWRTQAPVAWDKVGLDGVQVWGSRIDLARWAAWNPGLKDVGGVAEGRVRLEGRSSAPRFDVTAHLTGARRGSLKIDDMGLELHYEPDRLHVDRMEVTTGPARTTVRGDLPLSLSFYPYAAKLLEQPMDLRVDLPRGDLSLLPLVAPAVDRASGTVTGRVEIKGTPRKYEAFGDLELAGGAIAVKGREEQLQDLSAKLHMEGTTVHLVSLDGREAGGGTLSGQGTFELGVAPEKSYKLELDLKRFVVRQSGDYAARFDGHFEVVPLPLSDGTVRPMTEGTIRLDRAEVIREFNKVEPAPEPGQVFYYTLTVDAPRGIFIVNSAVDMELRGNITARRTPQRAELIGDLEILRGWYTLLLNRFRITSGTLTFNKVDAIDPEIDITADTNDPEYVITVHITGVASNPVIAFSAEPRREGAPALTQDQILNRLAPGGALVDQLLGYDKTGATRGDVASIVTGSVQLFLSQVQRDLARRFGVDEVRYEAPGAADAKSYGSLSFSKWLTRDVAVSYTQGLAGFQEQNLSVEYRLGRLLFLRGELIRRPTKNEEEYNVDLRFWHEY